MLTLEVFRSIQEERCEMGFHVGDKVIHCTHGLGEIVQIEQKNIRDQLTNCYVVRIQDMLIWIPIDDPRQQSLRLPAQPEEFVGLSAILTSPGEQLQEDRLLRKDQLLTQMRDGQLESICRVVRDLTQYKRSKKLNDQESSILERATNSLLTEWSLSLGMSENQAQLAMTKLLESEGVTPHVRQEYQGYQKETTV
jgi:RNA polymerase-interacting CarD/CdnL/TRCF family regulator